MFTTVYLIFALPVLAGLFYLLAIVRILRANLLLGLLMLFFAPAGLYALFRYWGDPEADIRARMLPALAMIGIWIGIGFHVTKRVDDDQGRQASVAQGASAETENSIDRQLRLSTALSALPMRSGTIPLFRAGARLEVPAHFRFVDRASLAALYSKFDDALDRTKVGWLVHESVNLADDEAWFVEVDWYPDGYIAEADFPTKSAADLLAGARQVARRLAQRNGGDEADYEIVRYAQEPQLDATRHLATWVEESQTSDDPAHSVDCYAARLGRRGALAFTIDGMAVPRQELCLRSVRLAAARTSFVDGENYGDYSSLLDRKAKYDLAAFVTGTALLAKP